MKRANVFLLAGLAIILVAIAVPQPIIASEQPTLMVERLDDGSAIVSVDEPIKGIGFEVVGQAVVTVDAKFTANMPVINKSRTSGTTVAVYSRDAKDGVIATIRGDNWTIVNTKGRTADGKFFEPPVRYVNPRGFRLVGNFPNPFNPETEVRYELDEDGPVELAIYNVAGQRVCMLVSEAKPAGVHTIKWNANDDSGQHVTSGVYFARLEHNGASQTRRMVLLK